MGGNGMVRFDKAPAAWESLRPMTDRFIEEIGRRNDGFWDDGIYDATPYRITQGGRDAGFFAVNESARMLRALYLFPEYRREAQTLFDEICREYGVTNVMVATNDEMLLCLAMEKMHDEQGAFDLQAYNLHYGPPLREAEFNETAFSLVRPEEYPSMHADTENEWADAPSGAHFYRVAKDGETLGYGSIFPRRLDPVCADIGNFTLPAHRLTGVGRSVVIVLSRLVQKEGRIPCAGCWYYNFQSIRTLTSAGFIPDTRLFRVWFKPRQSL
jgi:GNAT superfamily N-acetyltransferase